jgi:1-acyl-sn-glycerol-3-phosphate acyltransferase
MFHFYTMFTSILRILIGTFFVGLVLVAFLPAMILMLPSRKYRIYLGNYAGHIIGKTLMALAGAEFDSAPVIEKANQLAPAIFISNHTSILDIFLGIWVAPVGVCGVAKKQVVWYPFFGFLYLLAGHLRIDRANHGQAVAAMSDMAATMKKYDLGLYMWPEGTRSRDGRLKAFKKGFAHIALATRLPIVPIVVAGAQRVWQHGKWSIQPATLQVTVLDAIPTDDWTAENLDEKIAMVRAKFDEALPVEQRSDGPLLRTAKNTEDAEIEKERVYA